MSDEKINEPVQPHHEHIHTEHHHTVSKPIKLDVWKIASAVMIVLLVVSILTSGFGIKSFFGESGAADSTVVDNTLEFINKDLLQGQAVAEVTESSEAHGLYQMSLSIGGKVMDTYVTKDGKLLFPNVVDIEEYKTLASTGANGEQPKAADVPKADKPKVELFVMSHCPYGTQAEKGILPVASLLKSKIDFEIKFVDYAMHGEKELKEQMNQVCIKNEQADKFNAYLTCFLEDGDGERCLTASNVDKTKLATCVSTLDKNYKIMEGFNDKSTWLSGNFPMFNVNKEDNEKYSVQGSPTLVINGVQADSARSPAAYLATICAAFNTTPEECAKQLSAEGYAAGFGYTVAKDSTGAATCG